MEGTYKRISRIENYFSMLLTGAGVSDNLFIGNLPAVVQSDWEDMVLVDVLKVTDHGGYAQGSANLFLYAKATDSLSRKPVKKLNTMERALDRALASSFDRNYSVEVNWRDSDYDANRNYFYNVVNVSVTIRKMNNN